MKRALVLIKRDPHYRRAAFCDGLMRHGYAIVESLSAPTPNDLVCSWNLHGQNEAIANSFRAAGAKVLVCENGPIGKDEHGQQLFSIARDAHHAGSWYVGGPERWEALGIAVKPWVDRQGYVLVCDQRGIGSKLMASPPMWGAFTAKELSRCGLPVKLRAHPGLTRKATVPLAQDLAGASVVAVWSSMGGVQALVEGIPVAYYAPAWVASLGARQGEHGVMNPLRCDDGRRKALDAVAWYQWSVAEIAAGTPFEYLLRSP